MSREDMKKLQDERLVAQVKNVYENVKYYRDLMDEKGVKPEDIKSVDDVKGLEKEMKEIQDKYEKFYKEKGEEELKKFNEEVEKLENDPEIKKQVEEAQEQMMKNAEKFAKDLMGESDEASE